jgi:hypothetical protein
MPVKQPLKCSGTGAVAGSDTASTDASAAAAATSGTAAASPGTNAAVDAPSASSAGTTAVSSFGLPKDIFTTPPVKSNKRTNEEMQSADSENWGSLRDVLKMFSPNKSEQKQKLIPILQWMENEKSGPRKKFPVVIEVN